MDAIKVLVRKGFDVKLAIVGVWDEKYKCHLEELVSTSNLKDRITFTGYVENPTSLIQNSDVLLICS
ncbi:MAG: glycosyltransferase [Methanomassiliicoccales archaeon]|nr:glycosyltransferase [Methanomassiliicoccales archaeon]